MIQNDESVPATVKAIVARGRSVDVDDETRREIIGVQKDGTPMTRAPSRRYQAGEEIELPIDEVATLRKLGYLVDPDNPSPPRQHTTSAFRQRRPTPTGRFTATD